MPAVITESRLASNRLTTAMGLDEGKIDPVHDLKAYWGVEAERHSFVISTYIFGSGQLHVPAALPLRRELPVPIE
jgi:hypothetical protein